MVHKLYYVILEALSLGVVRVRNDSWNQTPFCTQLCGLALIVLAVCTGEPLVCIHNKSGLFLCSTLFLHVIS